MYSIRRATAAEWAAWAVTAGQIVSEGISFEREATPAELLQRGVVVEHVGPDGEVYFHAAGPGPFPGEALSDPGAVGQRERYRSVPAEHKASVYQAEVVRCLDGSDLRGECCAAAGANLPPFCPATGIRSGEPPDDVEAAAVLAEAWAWVAAGDAVLARVPMVEVVEGDVVVVDSVRGLRFAGEPP